MTWKVWTKKIGNRGGLGFNEINSQTGSSSDIKFLPASMPKVQNLIPRVGHRFIPTGCQWTNKI